MQADLRLCWSHIPHCWKSHALAQWYCFQLWNELCDLIAKNPDKVTSLNIEPIIRQGLKRYTDQIGVLWNSLADYYIRGGHFERVSHSSR